ncbi:endonuclease domain-containing protein [Pseudonocardia aurantiaca]|uniref:Endonuclease domain-containing protein n=1 Tax=Pseudonocardia aurantiaca TaxID=75290 RepID=A0ABW4FS33_9PSEU
MIGLPKVFRGTAAIQAGLVTKGQLRGPRYLRLLPDVYTPTTGEPPGLADRSHAAYLFGRGRGVLSGYSAAELIGASCGSDGAAAELTVPGGGVRSHPSLLMHRDRLAQGEVQRCGEVLVTTPVRTAYDLARRLELVEAVVALDALANRGRWPSGRTPGFDPAAVLKLATRYPRARGRSRLPQVVGLADRRSGSPMETRLRLVLLLRGLPTPEVQYPVLDGRRREAVWLDLAYPQLRIGIEYEGEEHTRSERVLRDAARYTTLVDAGWRMFRFTKYQVFLEPDEVAATIRRALARPRDSHQIP